MDNIEKSSGNKGGAATNNGLQSMSDNDAPRLPAQDYDSSSDQRDMRRLGKTQELKRRFRFFSIVGYVVVLGLTWEFSFVLGAFSISNGGTAGAIWLTFAVCCGMSMVMLSLAEMASMAPTSGGQYHWVSEFAPRSLQKPLSFAVGWLCALGWQCAMPTVAYTGAQQVLAFISVCNRDYVMQGWHGALLTMAFVLAAIFFNTSAIGKLPILESLAVVFHVVGFFVFVIVLWVMGPGADANTTFTTFADDNGWGSIGAATLIAIVAPTTTYLGADSAVHLAEELKDASHVLPRAMASAAVINYVTGFIATITLMSNLGDIEETLADPSGQPWVAVMLRATGSEAATLVLIFVLIVMYFFCAVNQVTCSSRQVWAFARDKGLPFHPFLSRVRPSSNVPANAVYITLAFTCLLALIIIGSTAAFNIILSVSATGLFTSYIVCVGCVLAKRLRGEPFPETKFSLGRVGGVVVNVLALCFLTVAWFFLFFPAVPDPGPAGMNWAVLIYGVAVLFAVGYYFVVARHVYDGPVHYVRWQAKQEATE